MISRACGNPVLESYLLWYSPLGKAAFICFSRCFTPQSTFLSSLDDSLVVPALSRGLSVQEHNTVHQVRLELETL